MNSKLKLLALSASVLAGFAATPAHAYVYADSALEIQNLHLTVNGVTNGGVTNFTFTTTNTAALNGVPVITSTTCSGTPGAPSATTNNCNATQPRLNPGAANAPGGSAGTNRGNTDFTFKGPAGGNQFSNSASSIDQSELLGDAGTYTRQIAESELQGGTSASATTLIQSVTGFAFTFTTGANGTLSLDFTANPDLFASIVTSQNGLFSAQANMDTVFTLQQQSGGNSRANFTPLGAGASDCTASGTLTCTVKAGTDFVSLNNSVGTTQANFSDAYSHNDVTFTPFGIMITGLTSGTYRLTLAADTSTQLSSRVVPEPGSVALLGVGLAALALGSRRRKQMS